VIDVRNSFRDAQSICRSKYKGKIDRNHTIGHELPVAAVRFQVVQFQGAAAASHRLCPLALALYAIADISANMAAKEMMNQFVKVLRWFELHLNFRFSVPPKMAHF
jgi:hypothetical protein